MVTKKQKVLARADATVAVGSIAVLVVLVGAIAIWGTLDHDASTKNYWLFTVGAGLMTSALASFVVLLFGYEKLLQVLRENETRNALGPVLGFWSAFDAGRKGIEIVYGAALARSSTINRR